MKLRNGWRKHLVKSMIESTVYKTGRYVASPSAISFVRQTLGDIARYLLSSNVRRNIS